MLDPKHPTIQHEKAAEAIVHFFAVSRVIEAVTPTCSCGRGKAGRDSCLDMARLVLAKVSATEGQSLERTWCECYGQEAVFNRLQQVGKYSHVDLDFFDGCFASVPHSWTSGADEFELEVGNHLLYSVPLWQNSNYLDNLKAESVPYYEISSGSKTSNGAPLLSQ